MLRVAFSLAVVMGLLWLSYRVADRSRRTAPAGRGAQLTVVARQGLSQKSAAVLLDSGGTRYLLGVTESSVTVIDQGPAPATSATTGPATPKHALRGATASRVGPFNVVKSTTGPQVVAAPVGGAEAGPLGDTGPAEPSQSFDEAVLAAHVWLGETTVPTDDAATDPSASGPAGPAPAPAAAVFAVAGAPSGVPTALLEPAAARSLLAVDTWRQAARAVWGPRR